MSTAQRKEAATPGPLITVERRAFDILTDQHAKMRRFIRSLLNLTGDIDTQEAAVKAGILIETAVSEPCSDECECANVDNIPGVCMRRAPWLAELPPVRRATAKRAGR